MADLAVRSQQNLYGGGIGYRPTSGRATARFSVTKSIVKTSTTRARVTLTITFKSNNEYVPHGSPRMYYELRIDGTKRGEVTLVAAGSYFNASGTYVRTLVANDVPLDHRTTQPASLRLINSGSTTAFEFDSALQGGGEIVGLPIGIQRSTFAAVNSFSLTDAAKTFDISVTAVSAGVKHNVKLIVDGVVRATWLNQGNITSLSLTQTQARAILNTMPSKMSTLATLTVETTHGGAVLYTQSRTTAVTVGIAPTIGSLTVADQTPVLAAIGAFVQGQSKPRITINSATAGYGTSIKQYTSKFGGQTIVSQSSAVANFDTLTSAGSYYATGRIDNNRGQMREQTALNPYSVLPWQPPRSSGVSIKRSTSNGTIKDDGTYIRIAGTHTISPLKLGTAIKNTLRVLIEYKLTTASTWTVAVNKTYPALTTETFETHIIGGGNIDPTLTYEARITVYDRFAQTQSADIIPTDKMAFSFGKDGTGHGKAWERGAIDAKGNAYIDGDIVLTGSIDMAEIGTTNLVLDSFAPIQPTANYLVNTYKLTEDWQTDQWYTVTMKGSFSQSPRVFANGSMSSMPYATQTSAGVWTVTHKFTSITTNSDPQTLRVYNYPNTAGQLASIEWIQLKKGRVKTDYTPAPQSLVEKIFFRVGGQPYIIPLGFNQQKFVTVTTNVTDRAFFALFTRFGAATPVVTVLKESSHVTYSIGANSVSITPAYSAHGLVMAGVPSAGGV